MTFTVLCVGSGVHSYVQLDFRGTIGKVSSFPVQSVLAHAHSAAIRSDLCSFCLRLVYGHQLTTQQTYGSHHFVTHYHPYPELCNLYIARIDLRAVGS